MKKLFICSLFIIITSTAYSQLIFFSVGKTISSFNYKNSEGETLDNLQGSNQSGLGLGYRQSVMRTPFYVSASANYNNYGAKGSDKTLGNYYEWDLVYLGINLGVDYEFFRPPLNRNEQHGFSVCVKANIASEFMLQGTQIFNSQINDLNGVEEFDKPLYFVRGGLGVNYYISKTFILFAEYVGGTSFLIGNYNNQEQLKLITHNINIGLSINLMTNN
ncbi:MAG: hypothetical protein A2W99_01655 [Bacteroidetes bacterium GWF2_33_16]|nr:MAG: hypothetical protein A2X00_16500 [Bacteroidetes bacterium GWE2_32_14]OFY06976.1 MAG: hypothetical protein A2W99_01655 [Bacteroidetes bacterium GWF2_33_16]